jgi:hypothetical protein
VSPSKVGLLGCDKRPISTVGFSSNTQLFLRVWKVATWNFSGK